MRHITAPMMIAGGISLALHSLVLFNTREQADLPASTMSNKLNLVLVESFDSNQTGNNHNSARQRSKKTGPEKLTEAVHEAIARKSALLKYPHRNKPEHTQQANSTSSTSGNTARTSSPVTRQHAPAFIAMLHREINQYKFYPVTAQKMNQQGIVKVAFQLLQNGNILDLHIQTSSGVHSLDRAALYAVNRIQPFLPAKDFVQNAEDFQLDIIFKL